MGENLLKEIEKGSKMAVMKKKIITHYIYNGSSTITDLAREMDLSVPTVTKFIDEMCEEGYINDYGKLETSGGRHPSLYGLNADSAVCGLRIWIPPPSVPIHICPLCSSNDSTTLVLRGEFCV